MKTIKQIACDIGVSRQYLYRKIKQEPLSTSLQQYMSTVDNTIYIDESGEELLKSEINKNPVSTLSTEID